MRLKPCSLPLRHGKGMWLLRERRNEPAGESGVQGQSWRRSMLEDSSSGLTAHYGAVTTLCLTRLHMQISLSNIWWLHKDQSPILTDQTQNSCGGTISSFRHTHREEVAEKNEKKQLPVVGLDQCVNPHVVCRCQDALVLTHTHQKSHFNQRVGLLRHFTPSAAVVARRDTTPTGNEQWN